MSSFNKTPSATLDVRLDFATFLNRAGGTVATYTVRADAGITVEVDTPSVGVFDLALSGGVLGQAYSFGIEAVAGGLRQVQMCRLRIREARRWPSLPVVPGTGLTPDFALLLDGLAVLLDGGYLMFVDVADAVPDGALLLDAGELLLNNDHVLLA